jgi:hypothetical protein
MRDNIKHAASGRAHRIGKDARRKSAPQER